MRFIQGVFDVKLTRVVAIGAVAALLPLGRGVAQSPRPDRGQPEVTIIDAGGAGPDFDTRTVRRGFNLFGGGDAAFSGMRATGHYGTAITNYGDCTTVLRNCQGNTIYAPNASGTYWAPFFEVEWYTAAPPNEYVKIKQIAPSVSNALGGGWTAGYNAVVLGLPRRFGPADGTLGKMFSGATNTNDGSCRDHTGRPNGRYDNTGLQLLPTSDCPETWGSDGWRGAHPIDQAGYKALFDAQGDNFAFDFWRVPEANQRLDKMFLGTRHHTYGETSDYSSDVLPNWGSVVPGGTGTPVLQGYPLGLRVHFEAFNFGVPTVNDGYFVQVTVINESEKLWGAGIDYDSLYMGFSIGTLFNGQNNSRYALPDKSLVLYHGSNVKGTGGPCDDSYRRPDGNGCAGNTSTARGYTSGAVAMLILKSPLGDVRNKLFTRTTAGTPCTVGIDDFCRPGHPLAGDTITFNHQSYGDYGGAYNYTWQTGAQAAYGLVAGDENLTNAGRDPAAQTLRTLWTTFRSEDWNTDRVHYNKYVPPASPPWDYNHDGIPDTLALATCGRLGCVDVDGDTMPGGFLNRRGNIGGLEGWGPFALKAGDTTSVIYAMVADGDSATLWSQIDNITNLYLNFFLAPDAPPPARVVSTQVTAGTDQFGSTNPEVNIYFSDAPEVWVDPYLLKTADDIEAAPTGTLYERLRTYNSWLVDSLRVLARNNLRRIEIYKSCNGGNSWTRDANCDGDPTTSTDTATSGFGWRPYSTLDVDANKGDIPNVFTDGSVDGGRTYLYAFVGRSRGATLLVDSAGKALSYTFEPAISNSLSRSTSDPNVVSVYVPASHPAGYQAATVDTTMVPTSTVPFTLALSDNVSTQSYRAVFGNQIEVARDTSLLSNAVLRSVVDIRRVELVDTSGGLALGDSVETILRHESFTYNSPLWFLVQGTADAAAPGDTSVLTVDTVDVGPPLVVDTTLTIRVHYSGLGFVLAQAGGTPLFGSTTLTADKATPPALFGRAQFPGFTVNADNSIRGNFNTSSCATNVVSCPGPESQYRGQESRTELKLTASDTIVPRARVNGNMVQWREASSTRAADGGGNYEVSWADDPFGVGRGFVLDLLNPASTQTDVQSSLANRTVASTGLTDQATADLLGVDQADLVAVKLPFTVENKTFDRPVFVAMIRRLSNRLVLGNVQDTISVEIPEDIWVPGDALYLMEDIVEDSTTSKGIVLSGGVPVQRTRRAVTFSKAVLGCDLVRESCNPVPLATPGATGYDPMRNGDKTRFGYYTGFTPTGEYQFTVNAAVTGDQIAQVTDSALKLIKVVPNPFVIFSAYQSNVTDSRILFSNVPSRGTMRIYTVAGQMVQQITWEPADLVGDGDLFWDLKTREGIDIASGLYIWVLTAPTDPNNPASAPLRARGKFVVIRGDAQ
jgi:hypothetical protein